MGKSNVGWCDHTVNFYTWACTKVSAGCKNCYALEMAMQFQHATGREVPEWRGQAAIDDFMKMPAGAVCFINDMSDTYHESIQLAHIQAIHKMIEFERPDCYFLILTKRIKRARQLAAEGKIRLPPNLMMGTSVENRLALPRIADLQAIECAGRVISFEPVLEDLGPLDLIGIDWGITGGESGKNRRPFNPLWASNIRKQCALQGVAFYHKQGGALRPGEDRLLEGEVFDGFPKMFKPLKYLPKPESSKGKVATDQLSLF